MPTKTESKENLVINEDDPEKGQSEYNIVQADEYVLTETEKRFILAAERGDCASVKRIIDECRGTPEFSIDCVDPLNRSALISSIENENFELIELLLEEGIKVGDALLHAISEEYVEAVEALLQWEETNHKDGTPYSWEAVDRSKSNFTPDITPLILAAHRNNYEILKVLLDRGASLPMPHDVKCGCDECVLSQETDSLRHSQSRINAYRALSASSLIALSSRDPVRTAFELSWDLKHLQVMESEFRAEYSEMRQNVQTFVTSLLDHARTSTELEVMLNFDHEASAEVWVPGQRQTLERLKLAIKYKQKNFVAHPNVQQLLAAIWYDGLPGFRRKSLMQQVTGVIVLGCSFPIYSMNYVLAPNSEKALFMKKPFVKFIMHSTSYMFFLMLLASASLRIIQITFELLAFPWMLDILEDLKKHERGSLPGPIEMGIIMYIMSLVFGELKSLYDEGLMDYIADLWNIVDFISNQFYVTWILMRATSWVIVHRDLWYRDINPYFPREHWHPFDPMLIAEGAFAAGMIFSFLKLVHIFSINPHLGPLQVSLGRMIIDIIKFFFIYTLVLFAFGCGLNQLLWYYADLEKHKCYHLHRDVPDFDDQEKACTIWRRFANLFETSQSLFWASFGLVDLVSFDLAGIKGFTRFWALLLFGSYSVINIIVLLNMLIAMMSNSYQIIYEKADVEWKFARSQLWMSYFEDGGTLPPPFNMCPSMKMIQSLIGKKKERTRSIMRKALEKAQALHDKVMRLLVRRYVTAEQRKRDDFGITEDDIIEVRQDISSFRFELLDILHKNNMTVPDIDKKQAAGTKKGKVMERRIMKDFQIGIVEGIAKDMQEAGGQDVFSSLAKIIGKKKDVDKSAGSAEKKDWNAIVKKNFMSGNPIGSSQSSIKRRTQRSLRRNIIDQANEGLKIDQQKLVEFNPKLSDVTPTTRVAYVKFMQKTLTKREEQAAVEDISGSKTPGMKFANASMRAKPDGSKAVPKPAVPAASIKKDDAKGRSVKKSAPEVAQKAAAPSAPEAPPSKTAAPHGKTDQPENKPKPAQAPAPPKTPAAPSSDDKKGVDGKKAADTPASDKSKNESKDKPSDKPAGGGTTTTSGSGTGGSSTTTAASGTTAAGTMSSDGATKKPDDKKNDGKTPDAKKPPPGPPKPGPPPGQSSSAAGATGDRGKSTVTGRMISGWL